MSFIEIFTMCVGIALALGGVLAFLVGGYRKGRAEVYRGDAEYFEKKSISSEQRAIKAETRVSVLEDIVTQAGSIDKLIGQVGEQSRQIAEQHKIDSKRHLEQMKASKDITTQLGKLVKVIANTYGGSNNAKRN